jgi:polysaccharide export outer membrane protein
MRENVSVKLRPSGVERVTRTGALVFVLLASMTWAVVAQQPKQSSGKTTKTTTTNTTKTAPVTSTSVPTTIPVSLPEPPPQQPEKSLASTAATTLRRAAKDDSRYRIGPGDVLDIRVLRAPEFSRDAVRVDQYGMIRIPMIEEDVPAACKTEAELGKDIATIYLKYKKNPHVDVFVKEFESQPVAVIGAVRSPTLFKLRRRVRLLELLSYAGGPSDNAGRNVHVVHGESPSTCEAPGADETDEAMSGFTAYKLNDTLLGVDQANPIIRPGDIVSVPDADQVFVVGNVPRPTPIPIKDVPITVTRAIAVAGGTLQDTKSSRIKIVRQMPGTSTKTEIFVDLKAISKHQAEDILLQANDIVEVPTSERSRLLHGFLGTVAPVVSSLPTRVIP